MEWLNIRLTQLEAPEYVRSEPVERATWLQLLKHCCGQENGGIITDCADWKDRTWQQIAGVTLREVKGTHRLWTWEGNNLHVWGYPLEKETLVRQRRLIAAEGGKASGKARRPSDAPANTPPKAAASTEANASPLAQANASPNGEPNSQANVPDLLERKGKEGEGKGKEENSTTTTTTREPPLNRGCTLDQAFAFADQHNNGSSLAGFTIPRPVVTLWHNDRESSGWEKIREGTSIPIANWQADLAAYAQRYARNEQSSLRPGPQTRPGRSPQPAAPPLTTAPKGGF